MAGAEADTGTLPDFGSADAVEYLRRISRK